MVKHPKRRRKFRRYLRGEISNKFNLGTLAGQAIVSDLVDDNVTESTWLSSVKATWAIDDLTPGADIGPIMVGIAHGDYATSEILEWVTNTAAWKVGDKIAQEISRRLIRKVGIFREPETAASSVTLNDGKPITTKCGWMLATGQTVRIWAMNTGDNPLATTDPEVHTEGHANLWPK